MKTLEELIELQEDLLEKQNDGKIKILVGLATCGISAGAKPVMKALKSAVAKNNLTHVEIKQTGCIGVCRLEPMFEVFDLNGVRTTYVDMSPEKAIEVIESHIMNSTIVEQYTIVEYD